MEVAASGIAVASLAIQLLASTNTIRTFIRNVKDAPQELRRITGLLDKLSALFRDVADLLEQQTSLQIQGFPLPSDAILACLQSCEDSLEPLHKIVAKYQKFQGQTGFRRIHIDIRTALKTGDFLEFGTRMQQEITSLSAAIITNNTRIQLYVLPSLLSKDSISPVSPQSDAVPVIQDIVTSRLPLVRRSVLCRTSVGLNSVNLSYIKRYRRFDDQSNHGSCYPHGDDSTMLVDAEYILHLPILGCGLQWSRLRKYGPILPSLRVFPVIRDWWKVNGYMKNWSVHDFQKSFASGLLHPFARSSLEWDLVPDLLMMAAINQRADVYQLLLQYGVRADPASLSLIFQCILSSMHRSSGITSSRRIDTYRLILNDYEDYPSRFVDKAGIASFCSKDHWASEVTWLVRESPNYICGPELTRFQLEILTRSLTGFIVDMNVEGLHWLRSMFQTSIGGLFLEQLNQGDISILETVFSHLDLVKPDDWGSRVVSALIIIGFDVENCLRNELSRLQDGRVQCDISHRPAKLLTLNGSAPDAYTLDWTWDLDRMNPLFLLMSEMSAFTVDSVPWLGYISSDDAPFREARWEQPYLNSATDPWPARFKRRQAKKVRKERTRSGLKRTRSKMPGSWV